MTGRGRGHGIKRGRGRGKGRGRGRQIGTVNKTNVEQYESIEYLLDEMEEEDDPFATDDDLDKDYVPSDTETNPEKSNIEDDMMRKMAKASKTTKSKIAKDKQKFVEANRDKSKGGAPPFADISPDKPNIEADTVVKNSKKRKATKSMSKEDKKKFAGIIKGEEIIYNLNHKLHANIHATTAAWERVAKQMEKPGMYLLTF